MQNKYNKIKLLTCVLVLPVLLLACNDVGNNMGGSNENFNSSSLKSSAGNAFNQIDEFSDMSDKLKSSNFTVSNADYDYFSVQTTVSPLNYVNLKDENVSINTDASAYAIIKFKQNYTVNNINITQDSGFDYGNISEILINGGMKASGQIIPSCFSKTRYSAGEQCVVRFYYTSLENIMADRQAYLNINNVSIPIIFKISMLTNQNVPVIMPLFDKGWSGVSNILFPLGFYNQSLGYPILNQYMNVSYKNVGVTASQYEDEYQDGLNFAISSANPDLESNLYYIPSYGKFNCQLQAGLAVGKTCGPNIDTTRLNSVLPVYRFITKAGSTFNQIQVSEKVVLNTGMITSGSLVDESATLSKDDSVIKLKLEVNPFVEADPTSIANGNFAIPNIRSLRVEDFILSSVTPSYFREYNSKQRMLSSTKQYMALQTTSIPVDNSYPDNFSCGNTGTVYPSYDSLNKCTASVRLSYDAIYRTLLAALPEDGTYSLSLNGFMVVKYSLLGKEYTEFVPVRVVDNNFNFKSSDDKLPISSPEMINLFTSSSIKYFNNNGDVCRDATVTRVSHKLTTKCFVDVQRGRGDPYEKELRDYSLDLNSCHKDKSGQYDILVHIGQIQEGDDWDDSDDTSVTCK